MIRPFTAILAIILDLAGVYHDSDMSPRYGYLYILFMINMSVAYAFIVLATFYTTLKAKLYPFEPIGKFLCIKFVIFFAFWQSVLITGMVKLGWIKSLGEYGPDVVAIGLQNFLICLEMMIVSIAHLYTFSYTPFLISNESMKQRLLVPAEDPDEEILNRKFRNSSNENRGSGTSASFKGFRLPRFAENTDDIVPSSSVIQPMSLDLSSLPGSQRSNQSTGNKKTSTVSAISAKVKSMVSGGNSSTVNSNPAVRLGFENGALERYEPYPPSASSSGVGSRKLNGGNVGVNLSEETISLFDRHFAANAAIRDFNETMPVVVLPTQFQPKKGLVVRSDPASRVEELQKTTNSSTFVITADDDEEEDNEGAQV